MPTTEGEVGSLTSNKNLIHSQLKLRENFATDGFPKTKAPAFGLSHALEAWMTNVPFDRLTKFCDADEGEIVRYFRMTVQFLRQLSESPAGDATLRAVSEKAVHRINRGVIDAEAQLRMG